MNLLVDDLPETITTNNTEYRVRSHYKDCLRIMLAFEDSNLTNQEKTIVLLNGLYPVIPDDIEQAIAQANWFLNGGQENKEETTGPRVYSFSKDAAMIFAAFKQVHGIDLTTTDLHWWQFLALFQAVIAHENAFGSLVSLRYRLKTGKATKEEKQAARDIPDLIDIPDIDTRTLEEKDALHLFDELVKLGEQKRNGNTV
jgi:hypothetical protein